MKVRQRKTNRICICFLRFMAHNSTVIPSYYQDQGTSELASVMYSSQQPVAQSVLNMGKLSALLGI